ncbi:MAG: tetratricopeptide repeat protein [Beijerinckiaceae bacterium]
MFSPLSRRSNLIAAISLLSVGVAFAPAALARESRSVATPFEVADTLAGSWLAAVNAGARNDTLAASTFYREVLRYDPNNRTVMERAFVATLANGDMPEAFSIAEKLVRKDSKHDLARKALAVRAIKMKHFITARTQLSRTRNAGKTDILGTLLTAWTWQGSGKTAQALETVDSLSNPAIKSFRDYHAALIANAGKKPEEALKRIKQSYADSKTTLSVVLAYAAMLQKTDKEASLAALKELSKGLPRHPTLQAAIRDAEAGKPLRLYADNSISGVAEVLYQLGTAGNQGGRELAPMVYLRLATYLAPDNDLAIVALADIYERLNQHARAIDVYESMPESSPLSDMAQLQIGSSLESLEKKDEALKHLTALVAKRPKDAEAVIALANLQRSRKSFAEAADLYTKALDLSDKNDRANWSTYYLRGIAYERTKRWPLAEADFKKSLELYPDQAHVLNYLGYSWVDRGENLTEAFRMLRRAVELRPTDGAIVDSLGWAYYRLGKYDDAVRELERAIELRPSDPVINDHLGDVYWKVGRKLEAGFQWNHARDLGPEPEDKVRILRKIEVGLDKLEQEESEKKKAENASDAKPAAPASAPASAPEPAATPKAPEPSAPQEGAPARSDGG